VPLVTTTIGAEGMGLDDPLAADVCDEPRRFADAIVRLLADEAHWRRRSAAGLVIARRRFARAGLRADLDVALQQFAAPRATPPLAAPVPVIAVESARPEILAASRKPRLIERSNAHVHLADQAIAAGRLDDALLELRSILVEVQGAVDWWGFAPLYESLAVIYDNLRLAEDATTSIVETRRLHKLRRPAPAARVATTADAGAPL